MGIILGGKDPIAEMLKNVNKAREAGEISEVTAEDFRKRSSDPNLNKGAFGGLMAKRHEAFGIGVELNRARAGMGKFRVRQLNEERQKISQDRPGRRATILTR